MIRRNPQLKKEKNEPKSPTTAAEKTPTTVRPHSARTFPAENELLMKKNGIVILFACLLLMLFQGFAEAGYQGDLETALEWGTQPERVGLLVAPDGVYGPNSFILQAEGGFLLLDSVNGLVKHVDRRTGKLTEQFRVPGQGRDLAQDARGNLVVLFNDAIRHYGPSGNLLKSQSLPKEFPFIRGLITDAAGRVYLELSRGDSLDLGILETSANSMMALKTGLPAGEFYCQLEVVDPFTGRVLLFTEQGHLSGSFDLSVERARLGSLQLIGTDGEGNLYLDIELVLAENPIQTRRIVQVYSPEGAYLAELPLPDVTAARAERDLRIENDGRIIQLLRDRDRAMLIQWTQRGTGSDSHLMVALSTDRFHYNQELPMLPESSAVRNSAQSYPANITLTRSESLAIADSYVQHQWTAAACNIGSVSCGGKTVTTPSWVTVGSHQRVPYQWGGFSSLSEFDGGLSACKYAGDSNTTGGASSCAVGVDCSGFVSRAWKCTSKYGTSTLPQISFVIALADMRTGDIFNNAGSHVRMFVSANANGTTNCVESYAGSNYWRVDYTVRTVSDNSAYTPRRCNWISEDNDPNRPGSMTNPIVIGSYPFTDSNTTLNGPSDVFNYYSCAATTNESGPEVFYRLTLTAASTITVSVSDGSGVDIDVHLLTAADSNSCLARDDISFTYPSLAAGTYYITADTWVASGGYEYAGSYTLTVTKE